jgi:hypothetical protein
VAAESGEQFKTMLELTGGAAEAVVPKIEKLETTFKSVTEAARASTGATGGSQFWGAGAHGTTPITLPSVTYGAGGFEQAWAQ